MTLMKKGEKQIAEQVVSQLFDVLRRKYKVSPNSVLLEAINNVKPLIGFRNVRLRGTSYKIPFFFERRTASKNSP